MLNPKIQKHNTSVSSINLRKNKIKNALSIIEQEKQEEQSSKMNIEDDGSECYLDKSYEESV